LGGSAPLLTLVGFSLVDFPLQEIMALASSKIIATQGMRQADFCGFCTYFLA